MSSTLAESVEQSLSELEKLRSLGLISPELELHLQTMIDKTRTGRLFGHSSAVNFPGEINKLAEACSDLIEEDETNAEKIKESISRKFAGNRMRKPTELNLLIKSVVNEIAGHPKPSITAGGASRFGWITKYFGR
jgi:hypothetical protein